MGLVGEGEEAGAEVGVEAVGGRVDPPLVVTVISRRDCVDEEDEEEVVETEDEACLLRAEPLAGALGVCLQQENIRWKIEIGGSSISDST